MTTQLEQQIISKLLKRGHHTEGEYSALEKRVKQLSELLEISHSRNAILEAQIQQDEERYSSMEQCVQDQTEKGRSDIEAHKACLQIMKQGTTRSASTKKGYDWDMTLDDSA